MDIQEIKNEVDIIDLMASFGVKPIKKGKEYIALCPFHDDHHPSLSINREKGVYYCFACGAKGDVITFVEQIKGCSTKEAIIYLEEYIKSPVLALGEQKAGIKETSKMVNSTGTLSGTNKKISHRKVLSNPSSDNENFINIQEYWVYLKEQASLEHQLQGFIEQERRLITDQLELLRYSKKTGETVTIYCEDEVFLQKLLNKFLNVSANGEFIIDAFLIYKANNKTRREIWEQYKKLLNGRGYHE